MCDFNALAAATTALPVYRGASRRSAAMNLLANTESADFGPTFRVAAADAAFEGLLAIVLMRSFWDIIFRHRFAY